MEILWIDSTLSCFNYNLPDEVYPGWALYDIQLFSVWIQSIYRVSTGFRVVIADFIFLAILDSHSVMNTSELLWLALNITDILNSESNTKLPEKEKYCIHWGNKGSPSKRGKV